MNKTSVNHLGWEKTNTGKLQTGNNIFRIPPLLPVDHASLMGVRPWLALPMETTTSSQLYYELSRDNFWCAVVPAKAAPPFQAIKITKLTKLPRCGTSKLLNCGCWQLRAQCLDFLVDRRIQRSKTPRCFDKFQSNILFTMTTHLAEVRSLALSRGWFVRAWAFRTKRFPV